MTFLLDTNVVSEWTKPRPNPGVIQWLERADENEVYLSVVTLAELRFGIECLAQGSRRRELDGWLRRELPHRFAERIILVDGAIGDEWGRLSARLKPRGRAIAAMDALIAATAVVHGLRLVTRNARDFQGVLESLVNPWT